jgi:hypothetical protein
VKSVLYDVYEQLPPERWTEFFIRTGSAWRAFLDQVELFTPQTNKSWQEFCDRTHAVTSKASAELQRTYRAVLDSMKSTP